MGCHAGSSCRNRQNRREKWRRLRPGQRGPEEREGARLTRWVSGDCEPYEREGEGEECRSMGARVQGSGLRIPAYAEGEQRRQAAEQSSVEHWREKQRQNLQAGGRRGGGGAPGSGGEERSSDNVSRSSSPVGFGSSRSSSAFSSVSASGGRCSFRSDHDASFSPVARHLAGRGRCGDPDPDRVKRSPSFDTTTAANKSRECLIRPFRSEAFASPVEGKHWRRRPTSLDLNRQGSNVPLSSPGILASAAGVTKSSAMSVRSRSGTFPSPGTPSYGPGGAGGGGTAVYQKGWSSERVPLPAHSGRRYGNSSVLLPFNNGRALPSKWEDAEKWIFSPVSGEGGTGRSSGQPPSHRRPRSKSGPLGPPVGMTSCYSSASPLMPGSERRKIGNITMGSPLLTGVLLTERRCCGSISGGKCGSGSEGALDVREGGGRKSYSAQVEQGIARSASVHGWSDLLMESYSSLPSSQDEKLEGSKDSDFMTSPGIQRKDMATQMSPEHSTSLSPKQRPHFSSPPPTTFPTLEEFQSHISKLEFRDVQVDDRVTLTRWSKKHIARGTEKCSANIIQWKKKAMESRASSWEVTETGKCVSKREEAKITAWENLQKAKAEAEIRKLEMKLEKMRSSSMDKIFNKLRSAQRKAQEKRDAVASSKADQVARTAKKVPSCRKAQIGSLSGCFTCHVF
ncbi:hypothetical protein Taro_045501 [Colocasia esculenta]|uniref:Remorin C-terminal domain-containing protein n=1 Tax=Colocasia esculenta TaxID=4460 RepID=A0A843WPM7_COLES|nr:hypothetical protein [Colocasia esculenta]